MDKFHFSRHQPISLPLAQSLDYQPFTWSQCHVILTIFFLLLFHFILHLLLSFVSSQFSIDRMVNFHYSKLSLCNFRVHNLQMFNLMLCDIEACAVPLDCFKFSLLFCWLFVSSREKIDSNRSCGGGRKVLQSVTVLYLQDMFSTEFLKVLTETRYRAIKKILLGRKKRDLLWYLENRYFKSLVVEPK